nr:putative mediator of RNA polymerase II transcription subunit 8 [Ipomoea batatas]
MEPPPSSGGAISTTPTATAAVTTTAPPSSSAHATYADSDFSPRSRNTESWDEPPSFPAGGGGKLRLMCSYGGHIVPRPHDKSLCYVGGDTRIMVVDRHTSLSDLSLRLSKTLLNGRAFLLKYQLPSEDLDSLISVTTDEDLENMIDEYDRINANSTAARASRLRLFLFPSKSEAMSSIGSLIESSTKSDDWFLNALNGATSTSTKVFSESSSVNCLLGLDDDIGNGNSTGKDAEPQLDGSFSGKSGRVNNAKINVPDIQSVPDSPMVDTTSSFGSTSSSPSMANLPPIKVHVDENQRAGIEEQLSQMSVGARVEQKQEDGGFAALSSPPPPPLPAMVAGTVVSTVPAVVGGEYPNRVFSDDERSDYSAPVGHRKPPQTQHFQQQPKASPPPDLPSPSDSISSDSSITNPLSRQKHYVYQEPIVQIQAGNRVSGNPLEPKSSDQNTRAPVPQDSGYVLQSQYDQHQQFVHAGQFIHHAPAGAVPITSYYPIYPPQQQHHPQHPALEHQYPFYIVQARPTQAYNLPVQQTSYSDSAPAATPNRPQTPPQPTIVAPSSAYNPSRSIPASKPEMATGTYRTPTGTAQQLVQIAPGQHPQQYVGFSQIHHPSQSIAPTSAAATNYGYEFSDPAHAQIYYTQPLPPQMGTQHQTMTSVHPAVLPEASSQQIRTSQP